MRGTAFQRFGSFWLIAPLWLSKRCGRVAARSIALLERYPRRPWSCLGFSLIRQGGFSLRTAFRATCPPPHLAWSVCGQFQRRYGDRGTTIAPTLNPDHRMVPFHAARTVRLRCAPSGAPPARRGVFGGGPAGNCRRGRLRGYAGGARSLTAVLTSCGSVLAPSLCLSWELTLTTVL
jgi:hypothetical protein